MIGWIDALDPAVVGADAIAAIRSNYVFKTAAKGKTHMEVMGDGNFAGAIAMLPLSTVTRCQAGAVARWREGAADGGAGAVGGRQPGHRTRARTVARRRRTGRGAARRRRAAPVDHAAEFAAFNVRGAIEGGLEGYKGIREVFIDTFGSIARANTYYAGVRQMPFLGRSPTVHASTLGAKLASAEQVLTDKGWRDAVAAALSKAGGFNIRRNRNAPSRLSDHSFGWAVDLDDSLNPNLSGRFPGRALMAATGTDVVTDAMDTVASGGSTADLLAPIEDIRAASEAFKDAFSDETSLEQAMREHVVTRMKFQLAEDVALLDMVKAAAGSGKAGRKAQAELTKLLQGQLGEHPRRRAVAGGRRSRAGRRQQGLAGLAGGEDHGASRPRRAAGHVPQASRRRRRQGRAAAQGGQVRRRHRQARARAAAAGRGRRLPGRGRTARRAGGRHAPRDVDDLPRSFVGGRPGGARVAAQTEGTPSTVAAHGFMNMPSKLAAALAGSDGGDLNWLGVAGVHDLMHFELKPGDRPSLR